MTETRMDRMDRRDGALLRKVGDVIAAEPERYDQRLFFTPTRECGTTACIAGHAALVAHGPRVRTTRSIVELEDGTDTLVSDAARRALGLSYNESVDLFAASWKPAGDPATPLHERVREALYALADGATVEEVSA